MSGRLWQRKRKRDTSSNIPSTVINPVDTAAMGLQGA
jgi:hypothetical protein